MPSPAALPRFDLTLNGRDDFSVYAFNGREAVSEPYEFSLELVHRDAGLKLTPFIGTPARLVIRDISGTPRYVYGLVREMRRLHKGNVFTHYQCILVPRLWFLSQNRNHRIFQQASVPDIIRQILEQQGFAPETFAFKCFAKYAPREYCVQYGESDLYFISRLCEEEGIYYYFEHTADGQCLCFSDMPGGPDIPGGSPLLYRFAAGMRGDEAVFSDVRYHVAVRGNAVAFREWNFEKYWTTLPVSADEPDQQAAPVPPGMLLEDYRYPHLYQLTEAGQNYAKIQLQRGLTFSRWIEGNADVARLLPGFTFVLARHPRPELNDRWWVTACLHRGEQPQALEHEAPERGAIYSATCQAIPATTRFVPAERHPKVRIPCKQTALVAGPKQEDIHTDKYGRVKLRFFWDRRDTGDENASCWVRVAQGWAGPGYGCMAIPRIGQEVIVSFLEGDPDRPLVTGRVYNGANPTPYELPAHKTRTVLRSRSTPGQKGPAGFNELHLEDARGREKIFLQAQKDADLHVKNEWTEHILHDRHRTVDGSTFQRTGEETRERLHGQRRTELFANDNLTVHGDSHGHITGSWLGEAGRELHLESGIKIVLEAGAELTLRVAGSSVVLNDDGVFINGPAIDLNSGGSPGSATSADPLLPGKSATVASPVCPVSSPLCLKKARRQDAPFAGSCRGNS